MPISEIKHSLTVVRIFLQDIKMLFGLDKCAILEVTRRRQVDSSRTDLPDDQHIKEIREGYKYLGILPVYQNLNTNEDERQNNIGVYQKSQEVVLIKTE